MSQDEIVAFAEILTTIADKSPRAWVYLPNNESWSLRSRSAVLESDEVPPELEDEPDAGIPDFADKATLLL